MVAGLAALGTWPRESQGGRAKAGELPTLLDCSQPSPGAANRRKRGGARREAAARGIVSEVLEDETKEGTKRKKEKKRKKKSRKLDNLPESTVKYYCFEAVGRKSRLPNLIVAPVAIG